MKAPFARPLACAQETSPGEIKLDAATLKEYAGDKWFASHLPDAVALPRSTKSVATILRFANKHGIPVTARGAGHGLRGRLRAVAWRHRAVAGTDEPHQGNQRG